MPDRLGGTVIEVSCILAETLIFLGAGNYRNTWCTLTTASRIETVSTYRHGILDSPLHSLTSGGSELDQNGWMKLSQTSLPHKIITHRAISICLSKPRSLKSWSRKATTFFSATKSANSSRPSFDSCDIWTPFTTAPRYGESCWTSTPSFSRLGFFGSARRPGSVKSRSQLSMFIKQHS